MIKLHDLSGETFDEAAWERWIPYLQRDDQKVYLYLSLRARMGCPPIDENYLIRGLFKWSKARFIRALDRLKGLGLILVVGDDE